MSYDYRSAIKDDIREVLRNNDYGSERRSFDEWYEIFWVDDSVTGNASGSYTFNTSQAYEYVIENLPLLLTALTEFGYDNNHIVELFSDLEYKAEYADVTIRCYLLGECLQEVLDDQC